MDKDIERMTDEELRVFHEKLKTEIREYDEKTIRSQKQIIKIVSIAKRIKKTEKKLKTLNEKLNSEIKISENEALFQCGTYRKAYEKIREIERKED